MSSLSRRQRESRDERDQLCLQLRAVTDRSDRQLKSDTYFRASNLLPPAWLTKAQSPTEAVFLWPELLRIWEESGQRVGDTRTGRLKGFFDLVHEVAGLPPPAESSLRSAVRRYRDAVQGCAGEGVNPPFVSRIWLAGAPLNLCSLHEQRSAQCRRSSTPLAKDT